MTHHYGQIIAMATVTATEAGERGELPARFRWHGRERRVREVLASWHLRNRWWEGSLPPLVVPVEQPATGAHAGGMHDTAPAPPAPSLAGAPPDAPARASASDRLYFRIQCTDGLLCEVYADLARGCWVLDRVYD